MGKKIFVSYKYADNQVKNLTWYKDSTVRDYVDEFEEKVSSYDDIYKGESNDEDLSKLSDDTIWEKLKDRIYDSSVTIVFLSPGMKERNKKDRDQWIPWEISYSLKETSRKNKKGEAITSHTNAMLAVILPDTTGSYDWYLEAKNCCISHCTFHRTDKVFNIIRRNKFNRIRNGNNHICDNNEKIWTGTCSYIEAVKWDDFITDYHKYVDMAVDRQDNINEYDIYKEI